MFYSCGIPMYHIRLMLFRVLQIICSTTVVMSASSFSFGGFICNCKSQALEINQKTNMLMFLAMHF